MNNDGLQAAWDCPYWHRNAITMCCECEIECRWLSLCRDDDRNNQRVVTRFMKILEIQGIVPCLFECCSGESILANLKFEDEDDVIDNQYRVDASAKSRYLKLKIDPCRR